MPNLDRLANARKIGERLESVTVDLSDSEVANENSRACQLMRERDRIKAELVQLATPRKARVKELDGDIRDILAIANAAKRDVEITVEEWLTDKNEVVRVRTDNQEVIGNRVARPEELQESLFDDDDMVPANGNRASDFGADA